MEALGKHILAEYSACDPAILDDVEAIEKAMLEAARIAEATIINSTFHRFSPHGVSGVVVIQESHLAIHTWPEKGYASVDIFTCGKHMDPWAAFDFLENAFSAASGTFIEIARGVLPQKKTSQT